MKIVRSLFFFILLSSLTATAQQPGLKYGKYTWYEGLDKAKAEGKCFFLYISQKGCQYCKELDKSLAANPGVIAFLTQKFVLARHQVSTPYGRAVVMDMRLQTTPALVVQNPLSDKEPLVLYGITNAEALRKELETYLGKQ